MTSLGVYAGTSPDGVASFEHWLGRPVDFATVFLNQNSWAAFDDSVYWATDLWAHVTYDVNWSVPLTTWYDGDLLSASQGLYDAHYRLAASEILAHSKPVGEIYIRTGWEMNGGWFPWSADGKEAEFIGAYRQFVETFRSVSDRFSFEWTPNVGNDWFLKPESVYPGDDYVDVIGMDFYWNTAWEGHDPVAAFNALVERSSGLGWQQEFAVAHKKPTAISEWGVSSEYAGPYFEKVGEWFSNHDFLYQSYWNHGDGDYSGKLDSELYPEAGRTFRDTFGFINHAPVAKAPLAANLSEGGASVRLDLLAGISDQDAGDETSLRALSLTYRVAGGDVQSTPPAGIVFDPLTNSLLVDPSNATFTGLAKGQSQTLLVGYRVADQRGEHLQQSLTLTIDGTDQLVSPTSSTHLVLRVSGDAYEGLPQFLIRVDGQTVGDVHAAHASHAAGEHEDIVLDLPSRPSQVSVVFLNDLYGGSPAADRNLYVEQVSLDGHKVAGASASNTGGWNDSSTAQLFSNGEAAFHFAPAKGAQPSASTQLTLQVAGDAYEGPAEFVVKVDGLIVGGPRTTSASHAAGEHEDVVIDLQGPPGQVSIFFLNDLYGGSVAQDRNLYVEQVSIGGHIVPGARAINSGGWNDATTAQLFSNGEAAFHFDGWWA